MSTFERRNYSDQLNIDTPEQVELEFRVAGIGSRFVAVSLDHLIQLFCLLILNLVGHLVAVKLDAPGKWFIAIEIAANFGLIWAYFALFEGLWRGQTPGKYLMRLRVIKDSGRQITLFEALARNVVRFVDCFLPGLYLTGAITMLCNKANKRLGDFAAGTLVVHEPREEQPMFVQAPSFFAANRATTYATASVQQALFPADAIAKLQPKDLLIIDTFFGRALDLDLETRAHMAYRVAREMCTKMGVPQPDGNPERILEAIAIQMRGSGRVF